MSEVAIRVENLSKQYRIGGSGVMYKTLRESIVGAVSNPFRVRGNSHSVPRGNKTISALKDVSFEVKRGEVVGIIGRNGAGKSTLLKVLSRITKPTGGRAMVLGRVGSLLEVGTGFHGELTGRENIYLNGAILGMRRAEIRAKFDEIVDFAEIEQFLDTPVKHYSSGMYVRLAFAVAAHLEPEIMLVDEVLAVGDVAFQRKCLGKMSEVAKNGRTVLFVSHNMGAITRLCKKSILLDAGRFLLEGPVERVVSEYQSRYMSASAEWKRPDSWKANGVFEFQSVSVGNSGEESNGIFSGDQPVAVEIRYLIIRPLSGCQIGARIINAEGVVVFSTSDADNSGVSALPKEAGRYRAVFTIPSLFLTPGAYYIYVAAHLPYRNMYEMVEETVVFEVTPSGTLSSLDGRLGVIAPLISWDTAREDL